MRSRDEELGTAALVRSQPLRLSRLIALRLTLRAGLVAIVALSTLALAMLIFHVPLDVRVLAVGAAVLAYVGVWFLAVFFVASGCRSSVFNIIALTGGWIGACRLLPALVNLALLAGWAVRGGVELTLEQRLDMNSRWDAPKQQTMTSFVLRRPEWASTSVPDDRFSWPWYYAMHEMGDAHVAGAAREYHATLEQRGRWTARAALILPPLGLELLFERLAGSDLTTTLAYRDSVARYHEQLKQTVYPWIFRFQGLAAFRLPELPRHRFSSETIDPPLPGRHVPDRQRVPAARPPPALGTLHRSQ